MEVPRLTVLAEVCLLKVDETVDFVVTVLSCGADFKEVCDDDFFILDIGCDQIINFTKELKKNCVLMPLNFFSVKNHCLMELSLATISGK